MNNKTQKSPSESPAPLVKYRKKDAERVRQIDEMQEDVESKIAEVMASFKETPSKVELFEQKLHKGGRSFLSQGMQMRAREGSTGFIVITLLAVTAMLVLVCLILL